MIPINSFTSISRSNSLIVSLETLKEQAKIQNDKEDGLIINYAKTAERAVENYINAIIIESTMEAYLQSFCNEEYLEIKNWSTDAISSITYKNKAGTPVTLTLNTDFQFTKHSFWPTIRMLKNFETDDSLEAIKITFTTATVSDHLINQAIQGMVAQMIKYREDYFNTGYVMPVHFQHLLQPLRRWSFR